MKVADTTAAPQVDREVVDEWLQHVMLGRWDSHFPDVIKVIGERALVAGGGVRWRLTWDDEGIVVDEDNLTLLEVERVEQLTGKTWLSLEPRSSARDCVAFLTAALEARKGLSKDEVRERLSSLTTKQVGEMLGEYLSEPPVPFGSDA
jgi:hypothetical protein